MRLRFRRRDLVRLLVIYGILALLLLFTLPPLILSLLTSFKTMSDVYALPPKALPTPFTLESYAYVFVKRGLMTNLYNSSVVASAATLMTVLIAIPSAYGLARFDFRGRRVLALSVLFAYLLPAVALLVPFFVIFKHLKMLDTYSCLIMVHLLVTIPFGIWFMRGYFNYVPWELEEAAMVDGCSRVGGLVRVVFPLLKPAVLAIAFFAFITSWQEFVFALIFSGMKTYTAPVLIASFVGEAYVDWGGLAAATMTFSAPVAVLFLFFQRYLISGLMGGSVKG